ncbi:MULTISPECIES: NAD(P)-dependent oxidoreductase [unclassified Sphingobacterium]|uniref:NAD(P)-dependent oxidoreductase n=1 Tax=unclassified Sphingobacterium TaxID=2609468 RepID=UPI0020C24CA4|nr:MULTISPECIES: NAD(P)H-binding protein [unclassified Sphingobacterium]
MKVALIGATGFVGSHILEELVHRNMEVTAIARDVENLKNKPHVLAVQMDVMHDTSLGSALNGNDVVISAFNAGWTNPEIYDDYLEGSRHILKELKETGIKRFIVIGGAGSLLDENDNRLVDDPNFPKEIKSGALAAADFYEVIQREEELDWTFISPAIEMNPSKKGKRTGKYRTGTDHPVFDHDGHSNISVEDLAVAVVDEVENNKFIKKRFTAGY